MLKADVDHFIVMSRMTSKNYVDHSIVMSRMTSKIDVDRSHRGVEDGIDDLRRPLPSGRE
jgi:predicted GH43/DUF377 family glycosyl hydrolase